MTSSPSLPKLLPPPQRLVNVPNDITSLPISTGSKEFEIEKLYFNIFADALPASLKPLIQSQVKITTSKPNQKWIPKTNPFKTLGVKPHVSVSDNFRDKPLAYLHDRVLLTFYQKEFFARYGISTAPEVYEKRHKETKNVYYKIVFSLCNSYNLGLENSKNPDYKKSLIELLNRMHYNCTVLVDDRPLKRVIFSMEISGNGFSQASLGNSLSIK